MGKTGVFPRPANQKKAIALCEYAVARDPVNVTSLFNLGWFYNNAGRFDEAATLLCSAPRWSLAPGQGVAHYLIGEAILFKGQLEAALVEMQQETSEVWRMIGLPMAYHAPGRPAESDAALAALKSKYQKDWSYQIAFVHAFRGEADGAFQWLDKAADYADPGITEIPRELLLANLHRDPRWLPFLRKVNMAPEQLGGKFDLKVPR